MTTEQITRRKARRKIPLLSRFIVLENGCYEWTGPIDKDGYGRGTAGALAHRLVYTAVRGAIPEGLVLDHTCHNSDLLCLGGRSCKHRRCVNPDHLTPCTAEDNNTRRKGLPGNRTTGPRSTRWMAFAELLRDNPGEWFEAPRNKSGGKAWSIRNGYYKALLPVTDFEAFDRSTPEGRVALVRFVGEAR